MNCSHTFSAFKWRSAFWLLCIASFALSSNTAHAAQPIASSGYDYESCNWLVTYRNRTYDLAPLTREGLARPIEGDLRLVLNRVPEASKHLDLLRDEVSEAKFHSVVGTAAIMAFIGARVARSNAKSKGRSSDTKLSLDLASLISGLFFVKATYDSERATHETKAELLNAVNAFNARSPHKIEPAQPGGP